MGRCVNGATAQPNPMRLSHFYFVFRNLTYQTILFIPGKILDHDICIFHQLDCQLPNIQVPMLFKAFVLSLSFPHLPIHSFSVEMGKGHRAGLLCGPIYSFTHLLIYFFSLSSFCPSLFLPISCYPFACALRFALRSLLLVSIIPTQSCPAVWS